MMPLLVVLQLGPVGSSQPCMINAVWQRHAISRLDEGEILEIVPTQTGYDLLLAGEKVTEVATEDAEASGFVIDRPVSEISECGLIGDVVSGFTGEIRFGSPSSNYTDWQPISGDVDCSPTRFGQPEAEDVNQTEQNAVISALLAWSDEQDCVTITIRNGANRGVADRYVCPATVDNTNWLGGYSYGDTFGTTQQDGGVSVVAPTPGIPRLAGA